jgi:hypothetical protein
LTYAHELVDAVEKGKITFGAASDGDGDRNMMHTAREALDAALLEVRDAVGPVGDDGDRVRGCDERSRSAPLRTATATAT